MEKKRGLKTWGVGFLVLVGGLSLVQCGASRLEESGDTQAANRIPENSLVESTNRPEEP